MDAILPSSQIWQSIKTRVETYLKVTETPGGLVRYDNPLKQGLKPKCAVPKKEINGGQIWQSIKTRVETAYLNTVMALRSRQIWQSIKTRVETREQGQASDNDYVRYDNPLKQGLKHLSPVGNMCPWASDMTIH